MQTCIVNTVNTCRRMKKAWSTESGGAHTQNGGTKSAKFSGAGFDLSLNLADRFYSSPCSGSGLGGPKKREPEVRLLHYCASFRPNSSNWRSPSFCAHKICTFLQTHLSLGASLAANVCPAPNLLPNCLLLCYSNGNNEWRCSRVLILLAALVYLSAWPNIGLAT